MSTKTAKKPSKTLQVKQTQQLAVSTTSLVDNRIQHNKKALIQALADNRGIVTKACEQVGLDRTTFYKYFKEDPEFKAQALDTEDIAIDRVEGALHDRIDSGDTTATIFYLKTKGKKRGYVERPDAEINIHISSDDPNSPEFKCRRFIDTALDCEINGKKPTLNDAYELLLNSNMGVEDEVKAGFVERMRRKEIGA
jgi:hypothetical protein